MGEQTVRDFLKTHGYADAVAGKHGDLNAKITREDAYLALLEEYKQDKEAANRLQKVRAQHRAEQEATEGGLAEAPIAEAPADAVPTTEAQAPAKAQPVSEEETVAVPDAQEPELAPAPSPVASRVETELIESAGESPVVLPEAEVQPQDVPAQSAAEEETQETSAREAEPVAEDPASAPVQEQPAEAAPEVEESEPAVERQKIAAEREEAEEVTASASTESAEPAAPALEAEVDDEAEAEEDGVDPESLLKADRYKLTGTKVLGTLDLGTLGDGGASGRKRKRKRKNEVAEPIEATAEALRKAFKESTAEPATEDASKKRKRRRGGPQVDESAVEEALSATKRELEQGPGGRQRQRRRRLRRDERAADRERDQETERGEEKILRVTEFVSTGELANLMNVGVNEVIGTLLTSGMMVSINQRLDADTIQIVADEFGFEVSFITEFSHDIIEVEADDPADLAPRPPVVTIMGHVDHGKTSLLDYIREANVVAGEAGGITQHIGAYNVARGDRSITFLDTPGHEAFTAMRARGAQATDIVILVVAADDAVMPQTIEAINHAKAAEVPIVVAINKIDKPEANAARVMQQLSDYGVLVEEYGGEVQSAQVSAKNGTGIDVLLDKVLLQAELLELTANPDRNAQGIVIESRLDRGRGVVVTILVQNGTLEVGDAFVAGVHSGRVRAMFDERDQRIDSVGPAGPVTILGFPGAPEVGDRFVVLDEEREAREIAGRRQQIAREQSMRQRKHITLDEIGRRLALGDFQELNLIIKADVGGSVEALSDSLQKLSEEEVAVNIIHSGVGAITESDVMLASASDAVILGFQVRPMPSARLLAEREEIDIRTYSIIYDAIQDIRDALEGLLSPEKTEKTLGTAEVRQTFKVPRVGTVAGCAVLEGRIKRSDKIRLIRDGVVIYTGSLSSLKRLKDDVREVNAGYECGMSIDGYNDIKIGDQIESFEVVETRRTLASA